MTYEVVICDGKSSSFGSVVHVGSLDDCCKYAELHSKSCCISLMVRPHFATYIFTNGQKEVL